MHTHALTHTAIQTLWITAIAKIVTDCIYSPTSGTIHLCTNELYKLSKPKYHLHSQNIYISLPETLNSLTCNTTIHIYISK